MKKTLTALLASSVLTAFAQFPVTIYHYFPQQRVAPINYNQNQATPFDSAMQGMALGQAIAAQRIQLENLEAMKRQREIIERQAEEIRKMTGQ